MRFSLILLLVFVLCIVFIEGKKIEGNDTKGKKDVKAHGKHDKGHGKEQAAADAKKDKKKAKEPKAATPTVEVHIVPDHAETAHKGEHAHKHVAKHDKHHAHTHAHAHAHGHADAVHAEHHHSKLDEVPEDEPHPSHPLKPKTLKVLTAYEQCKLECRRLRDSLQAKEYVDQLREELNAAEEALAAENQNQQQQKTKPPTRSSEL